MKYMEWKEKVNVKGGESPSRGGERKKKKKKNRGVRGKRGGDGRERKRTL